ncbi:Pet127-domain-containing protein [Lentithecium fluviatile CBS 122367]|uniref:Pet127-domain-containing protein n=1 Tax=Lentithecium fluviatile CBS 122367 TaxID=1168545 RepID=A0A6G1IEX3_9PLEO|nr:Pet127-domain-containing protein [Lentithecium fluviatile CBS 122367]
MLSRRLLLSPQSCSFPVCLAFAPRSRPVQTLARSFTSSYNLQEKALPGGKKKANKRKSKKLVVEAEDAEQKPKRARRVRAKAKAKGKDDNADTEAKTGDSQPVSLKDALLGQKKGKPTSLKEALLEKQKDSPHLDPLHIQVLKADGLEFKPVEVDIPAVPRLAYALDRVLFNPGVYRLQDPSSRVYNFDPYLEKILSVKDFDFDALSEYKTSSKDEELLDMTRRLGTKFTGSTSSMSGVLQHFHFVLSNNRKLNHDMLSKGFPNPNDRFSKVTLGPDAIFLRYKDGRYAIDADKSYDEPNIMSWMGHSMEKLLTTDREEFERYRRSSPEKAPKEDNSSRCYHYSTLGNLLMRSQLDAHDPRLPGCGIFDLKTRAVVSIRMDHKEFETGSGYQIHHSRGEWESFEREFYDMTRATMLKYSLQVRMGRMNGIFVAYHNIERIFGFQYLSLSDMDEVLHGQTDTCLGDQEFALSIHLLDELLQKATAQFPETSVRLHFHGRRGKIPFMYIFAEPVTEEQADEIQSSKQLVQRAFARDIVGIEQDDPEIQKEWHDIQDRVDTEVDEDEVRGQVTEAAEDNEAEDSDATLAENGDTAEDSDITEEAATEESPNPTGPLMGWTLAIRNRVNGVYVDRPDTLDPDDSWTVEYHIKEIAADARWNLYSKVKKERESLIGKKDDEENRSLSRYRQMIRKYSDRGRTWRQKQDEAEEGTVKQVFRPLGPGSETESENYG